MTKVTKVLLTGGNGFIAAHTIDLLLKGRYQIVVTVRSEEKGNQILDAHPDANDRLSYVIVKDIAKEGAFDEAVQSSPFEYVLHTASPFHFNIQDPVKDFLDPAIKGTTGILRAIKDYAPSVKRVVITSSFAAIINPKQHPEVYNEESWNPVTWEEATDPSQVYRGSKALAERAAWEFVENEEPSFELSTINPPMVYGPVVPYLNSLEATNTSNQRIQALIQGRMKNGLAPTLIHLWADVRDVALAHVKAIEVPEAGGQRFFVTAGSYANKDIADIIREAYPQFHDKLPPADSPNDLPKDMYGIDNSKSQKVLGLKYGTLKQAVCDTVDSLLGVGA